ncbi:MAG: DNA-processing protein DprA [Armatimonadota bacterium]
MQDREAWYVLGRAQLGGRAAMRLLEAFPQPAAILSATPHEWMARAKLSAAACQRLVSAANGDLAGELERLERLGIRVIGLHDDAYPARLRTIYDPPAVLFVKGTLLPEDSRAIAIVGSRRASPYGRHVAAELAAGLAGHGFTVVSGLALGADAAAHEGTLRAGGRTLAVLGGGVDIIYPPEHAGLYGRIAASGAVISEAPPGAPSTKSSFPIRNRIISGLSVGVVVVEAPEKSGALITATHALEQGREVFAVPGSVNSAQSRGSHKLLRDGAHLVESVEDILEEINLIIPATPRKIDPLAGPKWDALAEEETPREPAHPTPPAVIAPAPALPPEEDALYRLLSVNAKHIDVLIEESGLPPAQVNAALLVLELKGLIQRRPGNHYIRLR